MQDFEKKLRERLTDDEVNNIMIFYKKVDVLCQTELQKDKFENGQENIMIILPLELDYDMIFAGLILPLLRNDLIDTSTLEEYASAIVLARSVLTIEKVGQVSNSDVVNIRSMLVAMAKDIRVIVLKLADILNESRHSKQLTQSEQAMLHRQVVDLYIPLSSRLGLSYIKSELQDLDLSYTHPNEYRRLMKDLAEDSKMRKATMDKVKEEIISLLSELNIKGDVQGRIKHVSSVYNKISQKNYSLSQIYDLVALRVIVNSVNECYSVLGAVHTKYVPIDGRFKDYIAKPKANGYQSLHTSILVDNRPLEIQIRTYEMHNHAEYGIAAHFLYKEHKVKIDELDSKLLWIRKLIENPNLTTNMDLVDELKTDVYSGEIFVQTPMGKIIELPENSTPIDFAYSIHSNVGNSCVGAKVNGKMVPLNKKLCNADIVEIITSTNAKGPSKDWLSFIQSSIARNRINQYFKKEMKDENIKKGKSMLDLSAKSKDADLRVLMDDRWMPDLFARYSLKNLDDMYAMIGCGGITTTQILNRLIALYGDYNKQHNEFSFKPVVIQNKEAEKGSISELNCMLVKYAHCCNPVPGDQIVGFVSRGRGVTIHRADCKALKNLDADRLMPLNWNTTSINSETNYVATINLLVNNTSGVLANIVNKIAEQKINISSIKSKNAKDGKVLVAIDIAISSKDVLVNLISKLKNVNDVLSVTRNSGEVK